MNIPLRLGVNIDHVATLRNARGGTHPDPLVAARIAWEAGADGITLHLREDRRHIRDADVVRIKEGIALPLNFEMAATEEMLQFALAIRPHACCIVPEKREELTTEGGLDVMGQHERLQGYISRLKASGARVSLFIAPVLEQVKAAHGVGADIVELHTGQYCEATGEAQVKELAAITKAAHVAQAFDLECHAGHGLNYDTVGAIAAIPEIVELNIGHFLIGQALYDGLFVAVQKMRRIMDEARGT